MTANWLSAAQIGGSVSVLRGHPPSLSVTSYIGVADVRHRLGLVFRHGLLALPLEEWHLYALVAWMIVALAH